MNFNKALLINIDQSALDAEYWNQLDQLASKRIHLPKDSEEIMKELADTDCLLVSFGMLVTKEMIDAAPHLKYIGILATAYGKVDINYAKEKGILVCNLGGYSTEAVAEFSIAAVLENIRQLEEGKRRGREGNYSEEGMQAKEIKGKVFGVIGLGNIGKRVAELASGFGADVRYWSRQKKEVSFIYQDVDALIAEADFLSINLAQTWETEKFLSQQRFQSLKKGAVVICTVPMELVDIDGLEKRLKQNDIVFIMDHSDETSPEVMKRLISYKNCIIYPPIAFITVEARKERKDRFISNIRNFLNGSPTNIVNG